MSRTSTAIALAAAAALVGLNGVYMHYIRAPSVMAVRPELETVGFWTALFSGRFFEWVWYFHPYPVAIAEFVFLAAAFMVVVRR